MRGVCDLNVIYFVQINDLLCFSNQRVYFNIDTNKGSNFFKSGKGSAPQINRNPSI